MCSVQPQDRFRRIQFSRKTNEPNHPPPTLTPADSGAASWRRRSHGDGGSLLTASPGRRRVGVRREGTRERHPAGDGTQGFSAEASRGRATGEGLLAPTPPTPRGWASAKRPPAFPASPALTFSPLPLTHHAGG